MVLVELLVRLTGVRASALALLVAQVLADHLTRPCRRITLHLSQIFLTLGLTFIACSSAAAVAPLHRG